MRDTIDMAREAGIDAEKDTLCRYEGWLEPLKAFEALVRADEREVIREARRSLTAPRPHADSSPCQT